MIKSLIRPHLKNLAPYVCARNLFQKGVLLDANENAFADKTFSRYPDPDSKKLRAALADYANVKSENVFVGAGSDEIIDLLIRLFAAPEKEIIVLEPTYGMYRVAAEINNVKVKTCLLDENFQPDLRAMEKLIAPKLKSLQRGSCGPRAEATKGRGASPSVFGGSEAGQMRLCVARRARGGTVGSPRTKILFCASPNSPTGNMLNIEDLEKICAMFRGIVVIDEAYIEFSSQPSFAENLDRFQNLVILRTLSKAWGLAGIRVGYCLADPLIIEYLIKIKPPYNVSGISAALAEKTLNKKEKLARWRQKIVYERNRLGHGLKKLGAKVFPSETNFLLVKIPGAKTLVKKLAENYGIIVRDFSTKPLLKDCFRVTVGTPEENKTLLQTLSILL